MILKFMAPTVTLFKNLIKSERLADGPCRTFMMDLSLHSTDCYRKGANGMWVQNPSINGETVTLTSVELAIATERCLRKLPDR